MSLYGMDIDFEPNDLLATEFGRLLTDKNIVDYDIDLTT
jgi:hypothetical protein